jgi:anti-anti-sigma regulatory factor
MHATFTTTYEPPVVTLSIVGELDIASRGRLAWRLIELDDLECTTVRLDVGQLAYIDAQSMRLIDQARERLEADGATLEIIAASLSFGLVSTVGGFTALAAASSHIARSVGSC